MEIVYRHIVGRPSNGRGEPHAIVEQITGNDDKPGRRTTIRLDRFRPTANGYRLVQDVTA